MQPLALRCGHSTPATNFFDGAITALFGTGRRGRGSVGFVLDGQGGGEWSVNFVAGTVARGTARGDLVIRMLAADFASLLAGTLDIAHAMSTGRFTHHGDVHQFTTLATFLRV